MNRPVYLELGIVELSKMVNQEFLYDYGKPKYGEKATDDICKGIAEDVKIMF